MVKPKKYLGQHFLTDKNIAQNIVSALQAESAGHILEIGAGTGILSNLLIQKNKPLTLIDPDIESIQYLQQIPQINTSARILKADFLQMNLNEYFSEPVAVIGNFPYNISSQILFHILKYTDIIPEVVGMFQKEVAERIAAPPGNKTYGLLSVLIQSRYTVKYLFTVSENVFNPPPKVKSGVIQLLRRPEQPDTYSREHFTRIVKTAFGQRRKTLRNSLKTLTQGLTLPDTYSGKRPEQLHYTDFIEITQLLYPGIDS
ncbi:MAG: ribosomal RNA small subunit methyltransferase A [Bacteroidia bacterium]|nr:MAG: ribosomal RNA small subunit methyltransferase A [Bacteroidia bacterium]